MDYDNYPFVYDYDDKMSEEECLEHCRLVKWTDPTHVGCMLQNIDYLHIDGAMCAVIPTGHVINGGNGEEDSKCWVFLGSKDVS